MQITALPPGGEALPYSTPLVLVISLPRMFFATTLWARAHEIWHLLFAGLAIFLSLFASGHVVLYKRDSRAAIAWVGFVWLVPLLGAVLYFIFGINRLRRQAAFLREGLERYQTDATHPECLPQELHRHLPGHTGHLQSLARIVSEVVEHPLLPGNLVEPLLNGDEAYPAMLEAMRHAQRTISLETYIFDRDESGLEFARVLGDAVRRGVQVRTLIDAMGTRYSFPTIMRALRHEGVRCATFLPYLAPWHLLTMNLRTHRKILIVDGQVGFTGGINIRIGNCLNRNPRSPVQDLHFRVRGPVLGQLQAVFADDWSFTTGERLRGEDWFPKQEPAGPVLARAVVDGPDEDFEKLRWVLLGALATARYSVKILTPYFLPDPAVVSALNLAAMRGVEVDILLPAVSNLPFVHWASRAMWWQVLRRGCRIWLTPPPFDHSKLMLIDGCWALLGSANWDPRSLRLNFECNLETYDAELVGRLEALFETKRLSSHQVTPDEVNKRSLPARLRDGIARLLTPYL